MSYLARTPTPADGVQTAFPVGFPLPPVSGRAGVSVYVYDENATDPGTPAVEGTDFVWTSDGIVTFTVAPLAGKVVDPRRETSLGGLDNTMQPGGSMRATELVQNDTQLLYGIQEGMDAAADLKNQAKSSVRAPATEQLVDLPSAAGRANLFLGFDAVGQPIMSQGTGADAGLRADLAASTGSQLVGFKEPGTGAVARNIYAKARDYGVSIRDFGAVEGDATDELANSSNLKAINRAIFAATANGIDRVFIPKGNGFVNAVGKDRWAVDPGMDAHAAQHITIAPGANRDFTLDVAAGGTLTRTANDGTDPLNGGVPYVHDLLITDELSHAPLVRCYINGGESIRVNNLTTEGNEANYPFDGNGTSSSQMAYQYAANLQFISAGPDTNKAKLIEVTNFSSKGAVGSGLVLSVFAEIQRINGVYTNDRTRRYRSCFTVTYNADEAWFDRILVDAFEYETLVTGDNATAIHHWGPSCVARSVLDIIATSSTALQLEVDGFLPKHDGLNKGSRVALALYRIKGDLINRRFATSGLASDVNLNTVTRCSLALRNGEMMIGADGVNPATSVPVRWAPLRDDERFEMFGVREITAASVTGGDLITTNANNSLTSNNVLRMENCSTDGALDYVIDPANCAARFILDGGALRSKTAIVKQTTSSTTTATYEFHLSNFGNWRSKAMFDGSGVISASCTMRVYTDGEANLDAAVDGNGVPTEPGFVSLISSPTVHWGDTVKWFTNFRAIVASSPAARLVGIPGVIAQIRPPSLSATNEFFYAKGGAALVNSGWVGRPRTLSGVATGTTTAGGDLLVTHGFGAAPVSVVATPTGTTFGGTIQPNTIGASQMNLRFYDAAGAVRASTAVTANWTAST